METDKKRYAYWDNIKGILIILVVFGHFLMAKQECNINQLIISIIYFFHMPAFAFVSGFFSKSEHSRASDSIMKLFIAYFLLTTGFMLWRVFVHGENPSLIIPYYSSWYLLALIIWRIIVPYLAKIKYIMTYLIIISLFSVCWTEINIQYAMVKVIAFYPFFMAGYLFSKEEAENLMQTESRKKGLYCLLFCILAVITGIVASVLKINKADLIPFIYTGVDVRAVIARIFFFITSFFAILSLLFLSKEKKLPFITKMGRNALSVYILHRPVTLFFPYMLIQAGIPEGIMTVLYSVFVTVLFCYVIGSDIAAKCVNSILNVLYDVLCGNNKKKTIITGCFCACVLTAVVTIPLVLHKTSNIPAVSVLTNAENSKETQSAKLNLLQYRKMTKEQEKKFDNAFVLAFAGDLILLEDQVKRGYNGKGYDFNDNFEYAKKYISEADYAVGVLEGVLGEGLTNFSNSNFDDEKFLYINFPDAYADAVKNAGFDLVTTANNHLADVGVEGLNRTINVLKSKNMDYIGTYLNNEEHENRVKVITKDGIKLAFIAYTYGINNFKTEDIMSGSLSYISNFIPDIKSPLFENAKSKVEEDFKKAKSYNPDLIVVLPHWGTQFTPEEDENQKAWEKIFYENGADVILGDHTHHVQRVKIEKHPDKNLFTLYSPGNFANIYRKYNGDASAIVEVYIDKNTKKVIGGAIIPMWTQSPLNGNYRALPVYDILYNPQLEKEISTNDFERVKEVHKLITKDMLGIEMDIDAAQKRYYFDEKGFIRRKSAPLIPDEEMKNGKFYKLITQAQNVCFIGDSVTAGSNNNGAPWYEPLEYLVKGQIYNRSWGGATTKILLNKHLEEIVNTNADLFIIAVGTNDVRYRDEEICAMTPEEYTANLKELKVRIKEKNPNAKFIFIAPWFSDDDDTNTQLSYNEKTAINDLYSDTLEKWTDKENDTYINPNKYIGKYINKSLPQKYLVDFIHPNLNEGVRLYSKAVLMSN